MAHSPSNQPRNIVIVTDAWLPQVNGVVRTYESILTGLAEQGYGTTVIHPGEFVTIPCPGYQEIRLTLNLHRLGSRLDELRKTGKMDALHLPVEGPLGWAARHWAKRRKIPFTTSYHTCFPEYVEGYTGIPPELTYRLIRHFHKASSHIMVPTPDTQDKLAAWGINHTAVIPRGVDPWFKPYPNNTIYAGLKRPIIGHFGRIAKEKNVPDVLNLMRQGWHGSLVIIGTGPVESDLRRRYHHPDIHFLGLKTGDDLGRHVAGFDVFVFPSKTDTFGRVLIEANAAGVPWVAYPNQPGPRMILTTCKAPVGIETSDLMNGVLHALNLDRNLCAESAKAHFSRAAMIQGFLDNLAWINP